MVAPCIFCKIIARQVPSQIVAENDHVLVIKDINPKAPIHYLIIPKKHINDLSHLEIEDLELAGHMLMMAKILSSMLPEPRPFKLVANNGADAGQMVFHSHIHFLAGHKMAHL